MQIVLVEPEIPQNTGNIARTCAATGSSLHLVGKLGFSIDEKHVKRAGLDYWHLVEIHQYETLDEFFEKYPKENAYFLSTKAPREYTQARFSPDCSLIFGKETKGLPEDLLAQNYERCVRIPMVSAARSLNLANSVAIVTYEALRQNDFAGLQFSGHLTQY